MPIPGIPITKPPLNVLFLPSADDRNRGHWMPLTVLSEYQPAAVPDGDEGEDDDDAQMIVSLAGHSQLGQPKSPSSTPVTFTTSAPHPVVISTSAASATVVNVRPAPPPPSSLSSPGVNPVLAPGPPTSLSSSSTAISSGQLALPSSPVAAVIGSLLALSSHSVTQTAPGPLIGSLGDAVQPVGFSCYPALGYQITAHVRRYDKAGSKTAHVTEYSLGSDITKKGKLKLVVRGETLVRTKKASRGAATAANSSVIFGLTADVADEYGSCTVWLVPLNALHSPPQPIAWGQCGGVVMRSVLALRPDQMVDVATAADKWILALQKDDGPWRRLAAECHKKKPKRAPNDVIDVDGSDGVDHGTDTTLQSSSDRVPSLPLKTSFSTSTSTTPVPLAINLAIAAHHVTCDH